MIQKFIWLILLLLSLMVIMFAVKAGLANVYAYGLSSWHQRWQQDAVANLTSENIVLADSVMQGMLNNQPSHPYYLTLAAKQLEWRNYYLQVTKNTSSSLVSADSKEIADLYRTAAQLRPTWPNIYIDLAQNSWQHGENNLLVMQSLELAQIAAPYADTTLLAYLQLGLKQWTVLNQKQRADVAKSTILAMKTRHLDKKIHNIFKDPEVFKRACNLSSFVKHESNLCKK